MDNFFLNFVVLLVGFMFLIKGADILVSGAGSMAKKWGVSTLVIGLTVVSFGTSAPELFVNVVSSLEGANGITFGNVLGSNVANILLALGITALFHPIEIGKSTAWKEIPFMILATFLMWSIASDHIIDHTDISLITRSESIMLLGFFILFMVYTFGISKNVDKEEEDIKEYTMLTSVLYFLLGIGALIIGGKVVVYAAINIADMFDLSESLIGITIVALGTSLPEIVTTAVAAHQKHVSLAVGNIIGSNIFNILWILGVSGLINPLPVEQELQIDILFNLAICILLFLAFHLNKKKHRGEDTLHSIFSFTHGKHVISRIEGGIFVTLYIVYMIFLILRG